MKRNWFFLSLMLLPLAGLDASVGTEGASFLNIPVGAAPAALGGAYCAQAMNAYGPVWNPAGLGFLEANELAGQHVAYLENVSYEYASFVHPVHLGKALGASIQYLRSGDITQTDVDGNANGTFNDYYAAYTLAYGQSWNRLGLGVSAKVIQAQLSDVHGAAYAFDVGSIYHLRDDVTLAATLTNTGTQLTFLNEGDPLPMAFRAGLSYHPKGTWELESDVVYRRNGLASLHTGVEWRPMDLFSLRAGYRTDTLKGLSPLAGMSAGAGLHLWGQELDYSWVPYGDLGNTQYISLIVRFGQAVKAKRHWVKFENLVKRPTAPATLYFPDDNDEQRQVLQLLENDNNVAAQPTPQKDQPR